MVGSDVKEWVKNWCARIVRKTVVRGRAAEGYYSTDGHRAAPAEPEQALSAQRFGIYGLASECPDGTEAVLLAVNGGASNRVSVAELPQGAPKLEGSEVCLWATFGQRVLLTKDGDVVVMPKPGRKVLLGTDDGAADPVVTESKLQTALDLIAGHQHPETGGTTGTATTLTGLAVVGSPNVSASKT